MMQTTHSDQTGKNRPSANDTVIQKHMPLVQKIVRRISMRVPSGVAADDLFCAGALGLVDSVRRNGGDESETFISYARMRIKGAIYDEMRSSDWLPRRARQAAKAADDGGHARPTAVIRFDDLPAGPESSPATSEKGSNPYKALKTKRINQQLAQAVAELENRDRMIIHLHYFRGMHIKEIGRLLGISEARVSQIHHRALAKIRPLMAAA